MFPQVDSENVYERQFYYENDEVRIGHGVAAPPQENVQNREQEHTKMHDDNFRIQMNNLANLMQKTRRQITIGVATTLVLVVSLLVVLVVLHLTNNGTKTESSSEADNNEVQTDVKNKEATSCYDLNNRTNGIHLIKPEDDVQQIEVFCDMETDGGGWTLVASIHEDDIRKKCDNEDRWSKYVPINRAAVEGKTNWENENMFGNVFQCTQRDYKNSAYYALNASDVMVWHVPSHTQIAEMRTRAKLRYRTTNHFLQEKGGNLKKLFNESYPLNVKFENFFGEKRNNIIMSALEKKAAAIKAILPDWYTYEYETGTYSYGISDSILYSSRGNRINFGTASKTHGYLYYERRYEFAQPKFVVDTKKSQPFLLVAAISNKDEVSQYFWIKVTDYRFRTESIEILTNNLTLDGIVIEYRALQFSNLVDPTVCQFHFIIYSTKKWRSTPPSSFKRRNKRYSDGYRYNEFRLDGTPSNIIMGYMLLTRSKGNNVTKEQADKIADLILHAISSLKELFNEKDTRGLVVPVTFDKGSTSAVLQMIPPYLRESVEPGHLQFRAYNESGYPNAMCPGIKMNILASELGCIGGISDDFRDSGTCGDFAGWAGGKTDIIHENEASGRAHSQDDISSAILIFYR